MTIAVTWPEAINVILPILDGWTPITALDLSVYGDVIRRIEEVLGAGPTTTAGSLFGPKSGNADLAERLDRFLEPDGRIHDVAYATGTAALGSFTEVAGSGAFVSWGRQLSRSPSGRDGIAVLFTASSFAQNDADPPLWRGNAPVQWWLNARTRDGAFIKARNLDGSQIRFSDSDLVTWGVLGVGYEAYSQGNVSP